MAEKQTEKRKDDFKLEVPLDASGIEGFKPEQDVKVLAQDCKGRFRSDTVKLDAKGKGAATLTFAEHPGALHVIVGPANASDEELAGLQTINLEVSYRQLADRQELTLSPIRIHPYYWFWWLRWCRTFTIRGRLVCPDGNPVPNANVCAYDVDWWFIWSNTQLVGCATTDINGAFEIKFRWCCGWWPWWWWRYRIWQLNPILTERVNAVLQRTPEIRLSPITSSQPSLAVFNNLLAADGLDTRQPLIPADANVLDGLRDRLLQKFPAAPELEALHIWPWWPWYPWWDCAPDIIFKVTQDCVTPGIVVLDEGIGDTRWSIPDVLNVTLVANQNACCVPRCPDPPCCPEECLVIIEVCGNPINEIGGNTGAPAAPVGYFRPGAVLPGTATYNGDRPFAGIVPVVKNFQDMLNVDYYEIEYFDGIAWVPLPPGAAVDFKRRWMENVLGFPTGDALFNFTNISGHNVVESREHWEGIPANNWNPNKFWLVNRDLVVPLDSSKFNDGTYHFRVVGWQLDAAGNLINPRVLKVCRTDKDNDLVLTFDNRVIDPLTHDPSHNCGLGVHTCTQEPDTHFLEVRIDGNVVSPCDTAEATAKTLEIDFLVHDPDGHLALYTLQATYGLNLAVNLLNRPGSVLTPIVAGTPMGPTYGQALALAQGAVAPKWYGGSYRLSVPVSQAFPVPCCYQLELRAWKRTIVGSNPGIIFLCSHSYPHHNLSEYTIGVGVCPPAAKVG